MKNSYPGSGLAKKMWTKCIFWQNILPDLVDTFQPTVDILIIILYNGRANELVNSNFIVETKYL